MDHQPGPGVCPKKGARDRLIRLAQTHPTWVLGFADEVWWSRLARPSLHAWAEADRPMRLIEQAVPDGPEPKALACYGLLVRAFAARPDEVWLRFVDGRPISAATIQFLAWCCAKLEAVGAEALLLVWDNAGWHISRAVRDWVGEHNRRVKQERRGVRLVLCGLPTKSPWLNPIEPMWVHGKRKVIAPDRLLTADELAERVCAAFGCVHEPHLTMLNDVA